MGVERRAAPGLRKRTAGSRSRTVLSLCSGHRTQIRSPGWVTLGRSQPHVPMYRVVRLSPLRLPYKNAPDSEVSYRPSTLLLTAAGAGRRTWGRQEAWRLVTALVWLIDGVFPWVLTPGRLRELSGVSSHTAAHPVYGRSTLGLVTSRRPASSHPPLGLGLPFVDSGGTQTSAFIMEGRQPAALLTQCVEGTSRCPRPEHSRPCFSVCRRFGSNKLKVP